MQETTKSIRCGNCKGTHRNVDEVRNCYGVKYRRPKAKADPIAAGAAADLAAIKAAADKGDIGAQEAMYDAHNAAKAAVVQATPTGAPASEKQVAFIKSLAGERDVPVAGTTPEEATLVARCEDVLGGGKFVSKSEASAVITWLLAMPKRAGVAVGPNWPDVPEGHYAVTSLTGNNDLDFFRVDRPTEGKWAGRTFVKRVVGGKPDLRIAKGQVKPILEAIVAAGIEEARVLYGKEIGRCWRCNRHLTDETSRALGIGPDCRQLVGA